MEERKIVAVVIENADEYLLLKRAPYMKYHAGLWSVVSGTIEENESTEQAALRETKEETGLQITIEKTAKSFETIVGDRKLTVFPVLAQSNTKEIKISGEHIAFKWIKAQEIWDHKIVPTLDKDFTELGINIGAPAQKKLF
jgi:8-oxo-dGTP pyrophosphatase MutT (NUDIX family)